MCSMGKINTHTVYNSQFRRFKNRLVYNNLPKKTKTVSIVYIKYTDIPHHKNIFSPCLNLYYL